MTGEKILIIDDDVDFTESIKVVLEAQGYVVFLAGNKQEGLERIKQFFPDLIILDVMMDKMSDGFDLSREIKNDEKYKKIPTMILTAVGEKTGFEFSAIADDGTWLPVDDYAEKPISPEDLISRVKKLLSDKKFQDKVDPKSKDS